MQVHTRSSSGATMASRASSCSWSAATLKALPPSARPAAARRVIHCSSSTGGVQFEAAFLEQLQKSLQRQEQQLGEEIGIPGLAIKQSMAVDEQGADDASCKTGTMVWSAGLRLARHLTQNRADLIRGARILELGAGTGVVGITCAALGGHVILTDVESVVQGTHDNVESNMQLIEEAGGSAQVAPLDWAQPEEAVFSIPYDWIIGSDVTYEIESMPNLAAVLAQLIEVNPEAVVKLAHRFRNKELDKGMREIFAAFGLILRPVDVRTTGAGYDDPLKVDESIIFYRVYKQ